MANRRTYTVHTVPAEYQNSPLKGQNENTAPSEWTEYSHNANSIFEVLESYHELSFGEYTMGRVATPPVDVLPVGLRAIEGEVFDQAAIETFIDQLDFPKLPLSILMALAVTDLGDPCAEVCPGDPTPETLMVRYNNSEEEIEEFHAAYREAGFAFDVKVGG